MRGCYLILIAFSFLFSCNPKLGKKLDRPIPDVEGEIYTGDDPTIDSKINDTIQTDTFPKTNSDIVEASLHGLQLIEEPWKQSVLFKDSSVQFLIVRTTSVKTIVAIATGPRDPRDYSSDFFFYELDLNGKEITKKELYNTDFSCYESQNLQEFNGSIHYFKKTDPAEEWVYDLKTKIHKRADLQRLDWETIKDWRKQRYFPSPDNSKTVYMDFTNLSLISRNDTIRLISQPYEGTWSFGSGCWSTDGNTFFFDNSGATACIWKIDINAKTLSKIVPEHEAKNPALLKKDGAATIIYCEGSSIKIANP